MTYSKRRPYVLSLTSHHHTQEVHTLQALVKRDNEAIAISASQSFSNPFLPIKTFCLIDAMSETMTTIPVSDKVSVLCSAAPPFKICWASQAWLDLFGFTCAEALMRDLRCIQGEATDAAAAQAILQSVWAGASMSFACVNYYRSGRQIPHRVTVVPIAPADGGHTTLFRAISQPIGDGPADASGASMSSPLQCPLQKRQRLAQPPAAPLRFGLFSPLFSEHARVITQSEPPYSVVWASAEWLQLCNFGAL